jgi:hypothetical protein
MFGRFRPGSGGYLNFSFDYPIPKLPAAKFGRKATQHRRFQVRLPPASAVGLPVVAAVSGVTPGKPCGRCSADRNSKDTRRPQTASSDLKTKGLNRGLIGANRGLIGAY